MGCFGFRGIHRIVGLKVEVRFGTRVKTTEYAEYAERKICGRAGNRCKSREIKAWSAKWKTQRHGGTERTQNAEGKMQNEPERFGLSARCVPPGLAGLRPRADCAFRALGFRHAETFGDTRVSSCVMP